jgi:hypothetical protein
LGLPFKTDDKLIHNTNAKSTVIMTEEYYNSPAAAEFFDKKSGKIAYKLDGSG